MIFIITPRNWKHTILLILLVTLCCPFSSLKAYGQEITYPVTTKDVYNIAIIHSFNEGYSMDRTIRSLLRQELEKNGINAYFNNFYLNCEEYENEEEERRMYEIIDDAMEWGSDLIALFDDQATYSFMACNHPRAGEVPAVFSGVNYPKEWLMREHPYLTGFCDRPDYIENWQMIERILGKVNIYILGGEAYLDRTAWKDMKEQLKGQEIIIKEWNEIMELTEQHPDSSNVDPFINFMDTDTTTVIRISGDSIPTRELLQIADRTFQHSTFLFTQRDYTIHRITNLFDRPGFTSINEGFGVDDHILGGYFAPIETQIAEMAIEINNRLQGIMPAIQVKQCAKEYLISWEVIDKYGFPLKIIPEEYNIQGMPYRIKYQNEIRIAIFVACIALIIAFAYLLYIYIREKNRRKQAATQLKFEHENMKLAIEGGQGYVWIYDGKTFLFDNAFITLIGKNHNTLSVKEVLSYVHPDLRNSLKQNVLNVMKTEKGKQEYLMNFTGKYEWWEFRYKVVVTDAKKNKPIKTVTGILHNIQENKDREEELIQARKLAEKAELKQSFLTNMSHEIRTPLNAISGFSNLLVNEPDLSDEEKREFVQIIDNNTTILLKLVGDILELSRLESGNMKFQLQKTQIRPLMESIYQTHSLLIHQPLEFIADFPDVDGTIEIDVTRMTEVITNFLNNANKFTQEGYIKMGYSIDRIYNKATLFVEDTGKGIEEEEQKMIFTRFYKQDEFAQGAGLGLSLCKHFVEKMGGDIELASEKNKGSRFSVVLPLK